jgi:hypothetical protein
MTITSFEWLNWWRDIFKNDFYWVSLFSGRDINTAISNDLGLGKRVLYDT